MHELALHRFVQFDRRFLDQLDGRFYGAVLSVQRHGLLRFPPEVFDKRRISELQILLLSQDSIRHQAEHRRTNYHARHLCL